VHLNAPWQPGYQLPSSLSRLRITPEIKEEKFRLSADCRCLEEKENEATL
jgi:hypothetical protein